MALFGKKRTNMPVANQMTGTPLNQDMLRHALAGLGGTLIADDTVVLPRTGARLRLALPDPPPADGVTIHVWMDHPAWDRTLFDVAVGTDPSPWQMALSNVELNAVHLIEHHSVEPPDEFVTSTWLGAEHRWSMWAGTVMGMTAAGAVPPGLPDTGFWPLLKDMVVASLGNQKMVYVKVTAMWFGDAPIAEVRINNLVSQQMSQRLRDYITSTWPPRLPVMQKQLLLLYQDPSTTRTYPHTADEIRQAVITAGRIFDRQWNEKPDELPGVDYHMELFQSVGDADLVDEIAFLVPEIAAQLFYTDLPPAEMATLTIGGVEHQINLHQLASYAHLYGALLDTWCREVSERTVREWVAVSSLNSLVKSVRDAGHELSSLKTVSLEFSTNQFYTPH